MHTTFACPGQVWIEAQHTKYWLYNDGILNPHNYCCCNHGILFGDSSVCHREGIIKYSEKKGNSKITWVCLYCFCLLLTMYLQSDLIKGEASERSTGWNRVFSLISGVVCRGSSTDLWWCYSSICKRQKSPGAEAASRSGIHYNPSKHNWTLLSHVKVFSSAHSSKCHLFLQKQEAKCSQLWLYYFLSS